VDLQLVLGRFPEATLPALAHNVLVRLQHLHLRLLLSPHTRKRASAFNEPHTLGSENVSAIPRSGLEIQRWNATPHPEPSVDHHVFSLYRAVGVSGLYCSFPSEHVRQILLCHGKGGGLRPRRPQSRHRLPHRPPWGAPPMSRGCLVLAPPPAHLTRLYLCA